MLSLASVAESLIDRHESKVSDIFIRWSEIVGEDLASRTEPIKIVKMNGANILILRSENCCAVELQHDSNQIIDILNDYFKTRFFTAVRVVQG